MTWLPYNPFLYDNFHDFFTRESIENAPEAVDESTLEPKRKEKLRFTPEIDAAILNPETDLKQLAEELDCETDELMNRWFKLSKPNKRTDDHLPPSQRNRPLVRSYRKRAPRSDRRQDPYTMRDKSLKEQLAQAVAMKKDREELAGETIRVGDFSKERTVRIDSRTVIYAKAGQTDQEAIAKYEFNRRNRVQRGLNYQFKVL